jgi:regulator of sirC expression with transglutaminase-like and TPR domain
MFFQVAALNEEISGRDEQACRLQLFQWWSNWAAEHQLAETSAERFEQLRDLMYRELAFRGNWEDFFNSDNVLLNCVLERRRGTSTSLGIIALYFAEKFDLKASILALPGCCVMRFGEPNEQQFFDPFDGKLLNRHELELKLRCHQGDLARLTSSHLRGLSSSEAVQRWLVALKSAFIREDNFEQALRVSQILLRYKPDDPHEMRDRGFLFQQLDCTNVAINDYEYFIKQCPDDPVARLLKQQIRVLEEHNATIH